MKKLTKIASLALTAVMAVTCLAGCGNGESNSTPDGEKVINAYNNLKDWGMQISMGTVTTQPCIAVSAEANSDNIFSLTPSASSPDVIKNKNFMFQMCFSDPNQGVASAKYIKEQKYGKHPSYT